jgi:hypothetical protein
MSKKVDIRLPAVASRSQSHRHDRHVLVEDLRVAALLSAKKGQLAPIQIGSLTAQQSIVQNNVQNPKENRRRPMTSAPGKDSESQGARALLPFTAGDLCAQLDIRSRPIHQCDSLISAPISRSKSQLDTALSATSNPVQSNVIASSQADWQTSRALAGSALERLGSASQSSFLVAPAKRLDDAGSSARVNKLFSLERDVPSDADTCSISHFGQSSTCNELLTDSTSSLSKNAASLDKDLPISDSTDIAATISDFDSEVLDVWIDESDGTTGSSNSTGLAARDLLHLSSLAHDCTKGSTHVVPKVR